MLELLAVFDKLANDLFPSEFFIACFIVEIPIGLVLDMKLMFY